MEKAGTDQFWKWFAYNAGRFKDESEPGDAFIHEIDEHVSRLGNFAWELGPGYYTANMFVLSPGGDKARLDETRAVIARAPELDGWEFYHSRQPIQGAPNFILYRENAPFQFDASLWKYVLLKFPDNTFDILIKADNISELSPEDQMLATHLAIDGIVGEERRIELFVDIEVVAEFSEDHKGRASGLLYLPGHLKKIAGNELR